MSSKDSINKEEWRNWYDDLAAKVEALSTQSSSSGEISSTYSDGDHSDRVWQDLRATQDTNTRIVTDVDLLMKEVRDLKEKNAVMYKALMALQSDNKQLRQEMNIFQGSGGRVKDTSPHTGMLESQIKALERDIDCLKVEVRTLRSDAETGIKNLKSKVATLETRKDTETSVNADDSTPLHVQLSYPHCVGGSLFTLKTGSCDQDRGGGGGYKKLHRGVGCDGCDGKVRGIRHKCKVCFDYDLCEDCFAKKKHSHHPMLAIR
ncbi:uncharacterized protein [Littorina saxatilis]|uniref:ZZ-type domain-containing protein n=1 Tax=Littorina saxatilis TaxID=31220 RepID=A0AAN9ASA8_9CAEN